MEPSNEEAELLAAYAAGCSGAAHAFARLYDRHDETTFRFIRRTLGAAHADAAEDLHQETWLAVSRHAGVFDPARASFRAWLFTIARRKVLDHFRRKKVVVVAGTIEDVVVGEGPSDLGPTPLQIVETREDARRLVTAIEALPLAQRESLMLSVDGGLSLEEIAQVTGVGAETAKSRLRYARAQLRRVLSHEGASHV
jgi:RNA polymerase sigma factor (sigma-70 family)